MNFEMIKDVFADALIDNLKILPFLFLTFLLMEYLEDKMQEKTKTTLKNAGKIGPLWGSLLGIIPQCGFSAAASNLYAGRVITMGTLISIYLSTSDEMLPIIISIAAGKTLDWLGQNIGKEHKIVRCMPNTPALVGEGCTGICAGEKVNADDMKLAKMLLESCGKAIEVTEKIHKVRES